MTNTSLEEAAITLFPPHAASAISSTETLSVIAATPISYRVSTSFTPATFFTSDVYTLGGKLLRPTMARRHIASQMRRLLSTTHMARMSVYRDLSTLCL